METLPYEIHQLSNGMRVAATRYEGGLVSCCGVYIGTGSAFDPVGKDGLAHFVEHGIFKGTGRRRGLQVGSRMEKVGGYINAYTSKEITKVYTKAPAGYDARAVELLADIIDDSRFPEGEISKEKDVVLEELKSYQDNPVEMMYDEFDANFFKGSGLAHPILGDVESVRGLSSADCLAFTDRYYTPANMTAYILSPEKPEKSLRLLEKYFGAFSRTAPAPVSPSVPPAPRFDITDNGDNHQANCQLAIRIPGRKDPRRHCFFLLARYLGAGFDSRLSRVLREKYGLVYSVSAAAEMLAETGMFSITFGSAPEAVEKCRRLIRKELDTLRQKELPARVVEDLKRQYVGSAMMATDRPVTRVSNAARSMLTFGRPIDISESIECVNAITPTQLYEAASQLDYNDFSAYTLL